MKHLTLVSTFILSTILLFGQSTDYNKIIIPESIKSVTFEEKLVQLAWRNNPENKIVDHNATMLKKQKNLAKWTWLNNISAAGNVNEFTLNPGADVQGRAAFYPKYNFGLNVSLGTLFLTPAQVSAANERLVIGVEQVNAQKLRLRADVLKAVEILKQNHKVLKLKQRLEEDYLLVYREAEKKFSLGEIKIDEYRQASQAFFSQTESVIDAQSEFNRSKIDVEALIGLNLDDIEGYTEFILQLNNEIKIN